MNYQGEDEMVDFVRDAFNAINENDTDLIDLYISQDLIDLNQRDLSGHTLLTYSVSLLRYEIVDILLKWMADPNIPFNGKTPLDIAEEVFLFHPLTQENLFYKENIVNALILAGGFYLKNQNSSLSDFSDPSEPDYELMNEQMATNIQRIVRGRQARQNLGLINQNIGVRGPNPTFNENMRRYLSDINRFPMEDTIHGYAHDIYLNPYKKKIEQKDPRRKQSKKKFYSQKKNTKKKRRGRR